MTIKCIWNNSVYLFTSFRLYLRAASRDARRRRPTHQRLYYYKMLKSVIISLSGSQRAAICFPLEQQNAPNRILHVFSHLRYENVLAAPAHIIPLGDNPHANRHHRGITNQCFNPRARHRWSNIYRESSFDIDINEQEAMCLAVRRVVLLCMYVR